MTSIQAESSTETSPLLPTSPKNSEITDNLLIVRPSSSLTWFELIKEIYFQTIDASASKVLWPIRIKSLDIFFKFKERFFHRKVKANVYNSLILLWLELNMPFKTSIVKFSIFKRYVQAQLKGDLLDESLLGCFYQSAISIWNSLIDPSFEEIKNACIMIVARTISPLSLNDFHEILSSSFLTLINSQEELVSLEEFIYLVKNFQDSNWHDPLQCRKICEEFYIFGKRFILVDFPFSPIGASLLSLFKVFIKDQITKGMNVSLNFLEENLDKLVQRKYNINLNSECNPIQVKNIYFQRILFILSKLKKAKALTLTHFKKAVQQNKVYSFLNKNLKVEQKYFQILELLEQGSLKLKLNIVNPVLSFAEICFEKTKMTLTLFLKGLDNTINYQRRVEKIVSKYKFLKSLLIYQCRSYVTIRIPFRTLKCYGSELKEEVLHFYKELRDLNIQKVQHLTYQLYSQTMKQLKSQTTNKLPLRNRVI